MNPEYLSDGQLFESLEEWEKAFATDPDGTAKHLAEMQTSLEQEFSEQPTNTFDPYAFRDLIHSCRAALKELIAALPTDLSIFPTEEEKRAVLSPVSSFSTRLNELLTPYWELCHALGIDYTSLSVLSAKAEKLQSALFVAVSASAKLGLTGPTEVLGSCVCTAEELSSRLGDLYKQQAALNQLYHSFFREFPEQLVQAADLDHEGASASPAKIYELCGGETATLRIIENRMFPASLFGFPFA